MVSGRPDSALTNAPQGAQQSDREACARCPRHGQKAPQGETTEGGLLLGGSCRGRGPMGEMSKLSLEEQGGIPGRKVGGQHSPSSRSYSNRDQAVRTLWPWWGQSGRGAEREGLHMVPKSVLIHQFLVHSIPSLLFVHSIICSFVSIHPFVHVFIHSFLHSFDFSFICRFFIHFFVHSVTCSFVLPSIIHRFICSFSYSLIPSCMHVCMCSTLPSLVPCFLSTRFPEHQVLAVLKSWVAELTLSPSPHSGLALSNVCQRGGPRNLRVTNCCIIVSFHSHFKRIFLKTETAPHPTV